MWSNRPSTLPKNWPRIRARVLRDSRYVCRLCGGEATEVDHIIPRSRGGTDAETNLRPLCKPCHGTKSSKEGRDRQKVLRELRKRPVARHPGERQKDARGG